MLELWGIMVLDESSNTALPVEIEASEHNRRVLRMSNMFTKNLIHLGRGTGPQVYKMWEYVAKENEIQRKVIYQQYTRTEEQLEKELKYCFWKSYLKDLRDSENTLALHGFKY